MTYKSVRFRNIGPIATGEICRHPVNVFIGPTGAGKSIAARMIHGICHLDASKSSFQLDLYTDERAAAERIEYYVGHSIIKSAGIPIDRIPTHKKQFSSLEIVTDMRWPRKIDYMKLGATPVPDDLPLPPPPTLNGAKKPSMYIPAGRVGMVQSYANMARIRNALLQSALNGNKSLSSYRAASGPSARTKPTKINPVGEDLILPEYLELFYDTIFQSLAKLPTKVGSEILSRVFGGSVGSSKATGMPITTYTSSDGFKSEITSAASGILSSFPIIECIKNVKKDGLLIVEEPEAHLEPERQLRLVEELAKAARLRHFDLLLITHSDHTLDSVQSLVASGKMAPDDLGLYYFRRKNELHTNIKHIPVEKDGTAEQELFEDAIESLSRRFL